MEAMLVIHINLKSQIVNKSLVKISDLILTLWIVVFLGDV